MLPSPGRRKVVVSALLRPQTGAVEMAAGGGREVVTCSPGEPRRGEGSALCVGVDAVNSGTLEFQGSINDGAHPRCALTGRAQLCATPSLPPDESVTERIKSVKPLRAATLQYVSCFIAFSTSVTQMHGSVPHAATAGGRTDLCGRSNRCLAWSWQTRAPGRCVWEPSWLFLQV